MVENNQDKKDIFEEMYSDPAYIDLYEQDQLERLNEEKAFLEMKKDMEPTQQDFESWEKEETERRILEHEARIKTEQEFKTEFDNIMSKQLDPKELAEFKRQAEELTKLYLPDYWLKAFNEASYHNEHIGRALMHLVLGQALSYKKIQKVSTTKAFKNELDYRVHVVVIQDSRSGKGQAAKFIDGIFRDPRMRKYEPTMIKSRGYRISKQQQFTPEAFINNLKRDKRGNWKKELKMGVAESNDYIYVEEGRHIIETTDSAKKIQEMLMTFTETIGSSNCVYSKTLADWEEPCETTCTASFFIMSRPIDSMKSTVAESGMLQRCIFLPREIDRTLRRDMNHKAAFALVNRNQEQIYKNYDNLITELIEVINFGHKNDITIDPNYLDSILSLQIRYIEELEDYIYENIVDHETQRIMLTYAGAAMDKLLKLAYHSAIIRKSKLVQEADIIYAYGMVKSEFEGIAIWLDENVSKTWQEEKKYLNFVECIDEYLKSKSARLEDVYLNDLINFLSIRFNKGKRTINTRIRRLMEKEGCFFELDNNKKNKFGSCLIKIK